MVHNLRIFVAVLAAVTFMGVVSPRSARAGDGEHRCPHAAATARSPRAALGPTATYSSPTPRARAVTVFLQRAGGTLTPGYDDSARNVSALVYGSSLASLEVPAFSGGDRAWGEITACVERGLAAYAVEVVDTRPAGGPYIMMMVGGRAGMLGYGGSISGVAPYSGEVLPNAVGFVFADAVKNDVAQVCQSALHEVGHTLGLDHVFECRDTMSYLHGCGAKSFADIEASCGEYGTRECADGEATQSSHARLVRNVGLRDRESNDHDYDYDYGDGDGDGDDGGGWMPEAEAPEVTGVGVEIEEGEGYRVVRVAAWVTGATRVELGWATPDDAYLFDCDRLPAGAPVTCEREGRLVIYTLLVGAGDRMFAFRVTNASGAAMTEPRHLEQW
ncbi:MAG TPA: hypothetical protein VML75_27985 [Kofleriaceae bacterium]|nr:hypothetical protein [Kofleriaceae bacterium]